MADELLEKILRLALTPKRAEQQSGADRLRPPYARPLRGLNAATAGASRDVEVGYGRLPAPYQRALQAAPERQTEVGTFPPGYNIAGLSRTGRDGEPNKLVGDTAQTMTHELVHELHDRQGGERGTTRPFSSIEEALARIVAGDEVGALGGVADRPATREEAKALDTQFRAKYPDPMPPPSSTAPNMWSGFLDALGRVLGR